MDQDLKQIEKELEEQDKKLRHEPVILYCLGCGKIISKNFTGGLWDYTHHCNWDKDKKPILCRVSGSKERGAMLPSSIVCGYRSFARCKECKSEKEHTKRILEGLGLNQEFKLKDKKLVELRLRAITMVTNCCSKTYGEEVIKKYPEEFKNDRKS